MWRMMTGARGRNIKNPQGASGTRHGEKCLMEGEILSLGMSPGWLLWAPDALVDSHGQM